MKHPGWEFEYGQEVQGGRLALAHIGGGEAFETWLGWDPLLLTVIVLKLVRPHRVDDERTLRDAAREVEVLGALAHPIILRSFGADLAAPHPHLVLEHLDGPNLRSLIRQHGGVPLEQLLPLAMHIASALHYMHAVGYVHLDVKPRNLIMGPQPRLIDLSVARTVDKAGAMGAGVGTPAYMAPEQCDPARFGPVGPAADIWGLGVTLYEAITGHRPWTTPPRRADGTRDHPQVDTPPAFTHYPPHVPAVVRDLVARCLVVDAASRPTASEVALALEPVVADLPSLRVGKRGFRFHM